MPPLSRRVEATHPPIIALMRQLVADAGPGTVSLGQGAVHWAPPARALAAAASAAADPATSAYGDDMGTAELRAALRASLAAEHGLPVVGREEGRPWAYDVAVTAGANQAVASLALALTDPAGAPSPAPPSPGVAVVFAPYYFNAVMALQLAGSALEVAPPAPDGSWAPDVAWLRGRVAAGLAGRAAPVVMVYVVSPGNPTGVTLGRGALDALVAATAACPSTWLVLDSTYSAFSAAPPALPSAPHLIHVGSFSKAFGAAGWRVGWIAVPEDGSGSLGRALLKINDTWPIHAAHASQALAVACLGPGAGRAWACQQVAGLAPSRAAARAALEPLVAAGGAVSGGDAIYWWVTLPPACAGDDASVVRWLVGKHGVAVVPGSACGSPGHLRVAFGKPAPGAAFDEAARRLRAGCEELVGVGGMDGVRAWVAEQQQERGAGGKGGRW